MFIKYQHVERFGNLEVQNIELGLCHIFPKIDGTNASVWLENGEIKAGRMKTIKEIFGVFKMIYEIDKQFQNMTKELASEITEAYKVYQNDFGGLLGIDQFGELWPKVRNNTLEQNKVIFQLGRDLSQITGRDIQTEIRAIISLEESKENLSK